MQASFCVIELVLAQRYPYVNFLVVIGIEQQDAAETYHCLLEFT